MAVTSSAAGCLARHRALGAATFSTELECELWGALVLSEGDVATASAALARCERRRRRLVLEAPSSVPPPDPSPTPPVWWFLALGAAALGGVAAGALVGALP